MSSSNATTMTAATDELSDKKDLLKNPTVKLHNGVNMPRLSLGTAHMVVANNPAKVDPKAPTGFFGFQPERTFRQVEHALQVGMRSFDTAFNYRTHGPLAHVLGEWWRSGQLAARPDVWLTSKVFNPRANDAIFVVTRVNDVTKQTPDQVAATVQQHFEQSLLELNLGYIDLMLLHWPGTNEGTPTLNRQQRIAAWRVLETMYNRGWCRAIGVSNYSIDHLEQLKQDGATVVPMVNQIEASVEVQHVELREYCKQHGIVPQAYSVLRGLETTPAVVADLAKKYGKDSGQVAYRYLLQHGYAVVYLTTSPQRMVTNTQVFDFALTEDEMKAIDSLNTPTGGWGLPKPQDIP